MVGIFHLLPILFRVKPKAAHRKGGRYMSHGSAAPNFIEVKRSRSESRSVVRARHVRESPPYPPTIRINIKTKELGRFIVG
jgi:hypothetical protein